MICIVDTKEKKEEIINLWQSCFGDGRDYICFFLENCPSICIGYFSNNTLVSVLFLLEGQIRDFRLKYIYAACTAEESRGRGIMSSLIRYAEDWCRNNSYDGIFLVPAEDSLYNYYSRFGFTECFYRQEFYIKNEDTEEIKMKSISAEDAAELRLELLSNTDSFCFDKAVTLYSVNEHLYCGGEIFCQKDDDNNTLMFFCKKENNILVKEIISEKDVKKLKIYNFFKKYHAENIYIRTPLVYNGTDIGVFDTKCGMCLAFSPELKNLISERKHFYAGMYLD